jgi:hypothetical protein
MTAIDFLVEKLKLESIDLSLWHQNLINEAKEMERKQLEEAHYRGFCNANCQCFRLGEGSPWQTYLCEIHKDK